VWADNSNNTLDNPDIVQFTLDVYTTTVTFTGGPPPLAPPVVNSPPAGDTTPGTGDRSGPAGAPAVPTGPDAGSPPAVAPGGRAAPTRCGVPPAPGPGPRLSLPGWWADAAPGLLTGVWGGRPHPAPPPRNEGGGRGSGCVASPSRGPVRGPGQPPRPEVSPRP